MTEHAQEGIPEDAIRMRSYLIWQQEGFPEGRALDHWFRAKAELEAEHRAKLRLLPPLRVGTTFVAARPPISRSPCRKLAGRIDPGTINLPQSNLVELSAAKQ